MLKKRILSALGLLIVLGIFLSLDNKKYFPIYLGLITTISIFEWFSLIFSVSLRFLSFFLAGISGIGMFWISYHTSIFEGNNPINEIVISLTKFVALIWTFFIIPTLIRKDTEKKTNNFIWILFCIPANFTCWLLLTLIYIKQGTWFVLSLLILVWFSDICAYFFGRAFGKKKLIPTISPGKTIVGAFGSILGAIIWMNISYFFDGSYSHQLMQNKSFLITLFISIILGLYSIIGDLFASLLKRRAGQKDSGKLLPGHGGVYDRVDSILPVVPIAILLSGVLS